MNTAQGRSLQAVKKHKYVNHRCDQNEENEWLKLFVILERKTGSILNDRDIKSKQDEISASGTVETEEDEDSSAGWFSFDCMFIDIIMGRLTNIQYF